MKDHSSQESKRDDDKPQISASPSEIFSAFILMDQIGQQASPRGIRQGPAGREENDTKDNRPWIGHIK